MARRLVVERIATFTEVTTTMSIDDVDLMFMSAELWGSRDDDQ